MVRRSAEKTVTRAERKFGADGFIRVASLTETDAELNHKGRVFAHTTVLPGNGIGYHTHQGESEIYYIYSGCGEYNDNGCITTVGPGDVAITPDGTGHGIKCIGTEPLELIALILSR